MNDGDKARLLARLARAEGQVAAVRRMVEQDKYCVDVLVQIAAARGALVKIGDVVLRNHIQTCVSAAFVAEDEDDRTRKVDELMDVFARLSAMKSND